MLNWRKEAMIWKGAMVILLCFFSYFSSAQAERFKAGVVAGFNVSQLDGDRSHGYNKLGATAGVRAVVLLTKKIHLSTEILFAQRGSRNEVTDFAPINFKIRLDYVDVPVLFNVVDWFNDDEKFYRLNFHTGAAYSRLINVLADNSPIDDKTDLIDNADIYFVAGATYFANPHLGFTFRYQRSFDVIYDRRHVSGDPGDFLLSHFLTFRAEYLF